MTGEIPTAPRLVAVSHTGLVSGAETVLLRFLDAAAASGWEVRCACPDGPLVARLEELGVQRLRIPDLKLPSGPAVVALARLARRTASAGRRLRAASRAADAVVVNGLLALPALRLARPGPPVAWLVHDVIWKRRNQLILRYSGRVVDQGWAVSEAVAATLRPVLRQVLVIRNGTPWPVAPASETRTGPPVVGCAAVLTPWKGQDVLMEAVARLPRRDIVVELAGTTFPKDSAYAAELRQRAGESDLAGRVRFLGHVDDVASRMRTWSIGALPSTEPEAFSLTLLEYMSLGIPAVATDHGGSPEVLGEAGLLIPPNDADALAAAIGRLLGDCELWRSCARAGPRLIEDGLTLEHHTQQLVSALDALGEC